MTKSQRIRTSVKGAIVALAVSSLVLCALVATELIDRARLTQRTLLASRVANDLLRASNLFAVERGLTSIVLNSSGGVDPQLNEELLSVRRSADETWHRAIADSALLMFAIEDQVLFSMERKRALAARVDFEGLRRQVDQFALEGVSILDAGKWIASTTRFIEVNHNLMLHATAQMDSASSHLRTIFLFRDAVWHITENTGRERALFAAHIADSQPVSPELAGVLADYRGSVAENWLRLSEWRSTGLLASPVVIAIDRAQIVFQQRFAPLYDKILRGAVSGTYPVSALEWFREASRAIDSVIDVSEAATQVLSNTLRTQHNTAMMQLSGFGALAVAVAVLALFSLTRVRWTIGQWLQEKELAQRTVVKLEREIEQRKRLEAGLRRYEQMVSATPDHMAVIDRFYTYQIVNSAYLSVHRRRQEEIVGHSCAEIMGEVVFKETIQPRLDTVLREGRTVKYEAWFEFPLGGERRFMSVHYYPLVDEQGATAGIVVSSRDITEHRELEEQLAQREHSLRSLVENNSVGMLVLDDEGRVLFGNRAAISQLDLPVDGAVGAESSLALVVGEAREVSIDRPGLGQGIGEVYMVRTEWEGEPAYLAMVQDVTAHRETQRELAHMASHDALTGLPNRALITDRAERALVRARQAGVLVAMTMVDLRRLSLTNESLGHAAGDEVLAKVAARLENALGRTDTLARLGGNEFVVLSEGIGSPEDAEKLAFRLLEAANAPIEVANQEVTLDPCLGIAHAPAQAQDAMTLLRYARSAVQEAKKREGFCIQVFREEMKAHLETRLTLEARLRRAVERNEFTLHYQPQVSLQSGRIVGAEALLRWYPEGEEPVSPAEFVPILEEINLIAPVGEWVLHEACRQAQAWQAAGHPPINMSVNWSPRQSSLGDMEASVAHALEETGLEAKHLTLEITEGLLMSDVGRTQRSLQAMRALGAQIAVDDFGTGYSSLNYLRIFPVALVKIDRSFVQHVATGPHEALLIKSIIAMAHSMGCKVVGEGVETEPQLQFLRRHGCDTMQGFYFSRPVDAGDFEKLLQEDCYLEVLGVAGAEERTLLVIDDESNVRSSLKRVFRREPIRILEADSATQAYQQLAEHTVDVILCDQQMPEVTGAEFLERVKHLYPDILRIVLTGRTDLEMLIRSVNTSDIFRFHTKPWDDEELRESVRAAFEYARMRSVHAIDLPEV